MYLGVNILPQITGNRVSELLDFKNFVIPLEEKGRPLLLAPVGANKRETPTSHLTESTVLYNIR